MLPRQAEAHPTGNQAGDAAHVRICACTPVVHDRKLPIGWHKLQGPLSIKSIQGDALMEVAVIQHDRILRGATAMAVVMAVSTPSPADCQCVIQR